MPFRLDYRSAHRRIGIDRIAGLPPQFEGTRDGWLFRRHGHGPALPLSEAEHAGFVREGVRAVLLHALALPVFGWLAWLMLARLLPGWGTNPRAALFGVVLALIGLALHLSLRHRADAPARALAGRRPVAPARDPDDATQPSYGTILVLMLWILFMAAVGTRQPPGFYIAFATAGLMLVLFLAIRRWRFQHRLTPAQRQRLRTAHKTERRERRAARRWWQTPLYLLFLLVGMILLGVIVIVALAITARITGTTIAEMGFGPFMTGFLAGILLGCFAIAPFDRLCRRWTGHSTRGAFDWWPLHW